VAQVKLEWLIAGMPVGKDIMISQDWNGINSGVWLARNSTSTMRLLTQLWEQAPWLSHRGYPWEYEQRAFHYLMDTHAWQNAPHGPLPRYSGNSSAVAARFMVVEPCVLNSNVVHLLWRRHSTMAPFHYVDGDFIVHFPGHSKDRKARLFDIFYEMWERR
jgi:hypothetical protein